MTPAQARAFAEQWLDAWNTHDLERVLESYANDIVFSSPVALQRTGDGRVSGRSALRAYWGEGLAREPSLRLELQRVLLGYQSLTIVYRNQRDEQVAETFEVAPDGKVVRSYVTYGPEGELVK